MSKIETDYKLGKTSGNFWAGIYGYRPENKQELSQFGQLLAVMSIGSEIEFDLKNIGALLFDELQEKYYHQKNSDKGNMEAMEASLVAMRHRLEDILHREPELAKTGLNLEASVAVMKDNFLFAATVGEGKIYIARENEMHEVSSALVDPDLGGYMFTGSVQLQSDDRILLCTEAVSQQNSQQSINDQLDLFKAEGLAVKQGAVLMAGYDLNVARIEALQNAIKTEKEEEHAKIAALMPEPAEIEEEEIEETVMPIEAFDSAETTEDYPEDENPSLAETRFSDRARTAGNDGGSRVEITALADRGKQLAASGKEIAGNIFSITKEKAQLAHSKVQESGVLGKILPFLMGLFAQAKEFVIGMVSRQPGQSRLPRRGGRFGGRFSGISIPGFSNLGGGNTQQKYLIIAAAILVLIIGFGVVRTTQARQRQAEIDELTAQANALQGELVDIRQTATAAALSNEIGQRQEAVSELEGVRNSVSEIRNNELVTEEIESSLAELEEDIIEVEDIALKAKSFSQPLLVTDLATEFEGVDSSAIAYTEGKAFVIDEERGVLYSMATTQSSQVEEVASGLTSPYLLDVDTDGDLVIVDRNPDSVIANFNPDTNELTRQVGLSPDTEGRLTAIDVWSNAALYALSADRQAIVRQPDISGGYQIPDYNSPWRKDQDFSQAVDMIVDYRIFVLIEGKGLIRYLSGEPDTMEIAGLLPEDQEAMANATAIDVTAQRIYIADPDNQRILVLRKDLEDEALSIFEGQYRYRGEDNTFSQISDIIAINDDAQLLVLDGNQIIRLDVSAF